MEALLKCSLLSKIISTIKDLTPHSRWVWGLDGLRLQVMDQSNISVVEIFIARGDFDEYSVDEAVVHDLSTPVLVSVARCWRGGDVTRISSIDDEAVRIEIFSKDAVKTFDVKLLDLDIEAMAIPEIKYERVIRVDTKVFLDVLKEVAGMGDAITIGLSPPSSGGMMTLSSCGGTLCDASATFKGFEDVAGCGSSITEKFSSRYLLTLKALSDEMLLHFSPNFPMMSKYRLSGESWICIYLAPICEEVD